MGQGLSRRARPLTEEQERDIREWEADMALVEADQAFAMSLGIARRPKPHAPWRPPPIQLHAMTIPELSGPDSFMGTVSKGPS